MWDYSLALALSLASYLMFKNGSIVLPKVEYMVSIASDLSNISLTLSGFILTLLTVLITFKSGSKVTKDSDVEDESLFNLFFASDLYFHTVKHFKNCIKSLIFIAICGYSLKLGLPEKSYFYLYFYNFLGLVVIVLTLWRSLLILTKIIKMQKTE